MTSASCRYLRLNAQDVSTDHLLFVQRLFVEELDAEAAVMKLVAHKVALRAVLWEQKSFDQDHKDAFDGNISGHFDCDSLVSSYVPDFKVQHVN
jgi:hypothetical protein